MKNKQLLIIGIIAIISTISLILINFTILDINENKENNLQMSDPDFIERSTTYQIDSFRIYATIVNGSINSITKPDDYNSVYVEISPVDKGVLTIKIPKTMFEAINDDYSKFSFFVLSNSEEISFEQINSETIKIPFQNNTKNIEILGTSRLN